MCGCSSVVERHVANVNVVGSNPITRFSGVSLLVYMDAEYGFGHAFQTSENRIR